MNSFKIIITVVLLQLSVVISSGSTQLVTLDDEPVYTEYTNVSFWHAESPVWDHENRRLMWVDVLNNIVHALDIESMQHYYKYVAHGEVNLVIPIRDTRDRVLIASRDSIFVMDWNKVGNAALRKVVSVDQGCPDNILNEGKADALGRFWGGTKGPQTGTYVRSYVGTFYMVQLPSSPPVTKIKPVSISNGLAWSLDNTILYYVDSPTNKIVAYDFDLVNGLIENQRTVIDFNIYCLGNNVVPDGMTIDALGYLWVAMNGGGIVFRVDPSQGTVVATFKFPVTGITSVALGGENLDQLIVTTSRRNLDASELRQQPLSGVVFLIPDVTEGLPDNKISFPNVDSY